jgi:AcrR family transcriptional regulator
MQQRTLDTREKILRTAHQLFNEQGVENITVRHIAAACGISHGNLCYHFPNTDIIVEHLYRQLVQDMDQLVHEAMQAPELSVAFIRRYSRRGFETLYEYRFLMLDFVGLLRRIPAIRTDYQQLRIQRQTQFRMMFDALVEVGILHPEPIPGQFEQLAAAMIMLGDYFISDAEVIYTGPESEKIDYYVNLQLSLLAPYLSVRVGV